MENKNLKFKYIYPEDYCPVYVNTVHGGFTARGELEINFMHDRPPLPESGELTFIEGRPIQRENVSGDFNGLRNVKTGVIMDYASAKRLQQWLAEKLENYEIMMKKVREQQKNAVQAKE